MEQHINPNQRDYDGTICADLRNAIHFRLATPLGSYVFNTTLGSRLHLLKREKDLDRIGTIAVDYARQALADLVADRRATAIEVAYQRPQNGTILLHIEVRDASGAFGEWQYRVQVA